MDELQRVLEGTFLQNTYRGILSNPVSKSENYKRIELKQVDGQFLIEKYTQTQVFHETKSYEQTKEMLYALLSTSYKNYNGWNATYECSVQVSKKGKVLFRRTAGKESATPKVQLTHNREKNYILPQGTYIEPLVDMGIFTKEGKVVNAMYGKYKQINRFIEIVDDEIKKSNQTELHILDFGCGKSYLTFILYYYFTEIKKIKVKMTGLDLKETVIENCNATAKKYGYENLQFEVGDISNYKYQGNVDIVISLHACDTATDYALFNAISWGASMIFSVPCCQHELNEQMESEHFKILTRYGIVKERFASLLTDSIRCNLLEVCGYKTQMVEFVAFDHTPKNVMIRAVKKKGAQKNAKALAEVKDVMQEFGVKPTLYGLLEEGYLGE